MKLYIQGPKNKGDGRYRLITEDGEVLNTHICSHIGFALGDLHDNRPQLVEKWHERFGDYLIGGYGEYKEDPETEELPPRDSYATLTRDDLCQLLAQSRIEIEREENIPNSAARALDRLLVAVGLLLEESKPHPRQSSWSI